MPSGIQHDLLIIYERAQELNPYKFKFKPDVNRIRKYFVYTKIWIRISKHLSKRNLLKQFMLFHISEFLRNKINLGSELFTNQKDMNNNMSWTF
jgi:hypothetical protein